MQKAVGMPGEFWYNRKQSGTKADSLRFAIKQTESVKGEKSEEDEHDGSKEADGHAGSL